MSKKSVSKEADEFQIRGVDSGVWTVTATTSAVDSNHPLIKGSVNNCITVGWALMVFALALLTFTFPCNDVHNYDLNKALITYIMMLIPELGIWIPMWIHISPPEGHLKKTQLLLHASFIFFNHVSNILYQIIPSISYLSHGRPLTFINLFCGSVSFFMSSALIWLTIDLERDGLKWEHFSQGCNAALSATLLNISVFQLIVKKNFLHFPLFSILRDAVESLDLIMKLVYNNEENSQGRPKKEKEDHSCQA